MKINFNFRLNFELSISVTHDFYPNLVLKVIVIVSLIDK